MGKYIVLKIRLRSEALNFYSVAVLIIDRELKLMEKLDVLASRIPTFYHNCISQSWEEVQNEIIKQVIEGKNLTNLSKSVSTAIEKIFLNEDIDYIIKLIDNDINKFITILQESINRALLKGDAKLEVIKHDVNSIDKNVTSEDVTEELAELENENINFDVPDGVSVIPVKAVLAPVSGIPLYELTIGDKIYVNIDTSFERAKEYIEYFDALQDDKLIPLPAEILEIMVDMNNNYIILVKLDESTYGQIIEEEKVKIKRWDEDEIIDESLSHEESKEKKIEKAQKKKPASKSIIYIVAGIAVTLFIILILLLFL